MGLSMKHPRSALRALLLMGLALTLSTARADIEVRRPDVDTSALPAIAPGWAEVNPPRRRCRAAG
jgi:hypothetical protein